MVKMKCDDIHCWKLLLDLEGTRHNSVLHILLRLYSCPVFSVVHGQGNVYTGQGRTSVTSTWHWTQITVFQGIGL